MAAAPRWKVYNAAGEYIAACKHLEDAGAVVALNGDGATIRDDHSFIVWREGSEEQPAGESYDHVAEVACARAYERNRTAYEKRQQATERNRLAYELRDKTLELAKIQ